MPHFACCAPQAYEHGAKHLTPLARISYRGAAVDFAVALSTFVRGGQVRVIMRFRPGLRVLHMYL